MAEYIEREALPQKKERGFFLDDDFNAMAENINYYVNIKEAAHVILDYIGTEDFNKALSCLHNDVCSGFMGGLGMAICLMMDNRCSKYIIKETKNDS